MRRRDSRAIYGRLNAGPSVLIALALDELLGELPNAVHPVAWIGSVIAKGRDWALPHTPKGQLWRGAFVALTVPLIAASAATVATLFINRSLASASVREVLTALLLKPLFASSALRDAAYAVRDALVQSDVPRARAALGSLCSRDAAELDESELAAATIESVAENASDSIVAPLLYFAIAGLPGAAFYRACNTADAMIGYHGRFEWVGKTAARLDDVLNFVPARLTALLLLLVALPFGGSPSRGLTALLRDGGKTESPNAGRPMATMAGLLGILLSKRGAYSLGVPLRPISERDITRACRIVQVTGYVAAILVVGCMATLGSGE